MTDSTSKLSTASIGATGGAAAPASTTPAQGAIRRHPERAVPQEAAAILAAGKVAHVGFCEDGQPVVIPLGYAYDPRLPDRLYLHGAPASRAVRRLAAGAPVCVTVTLLDGLVYSRTALFHSMNYRSVVCFGRGRPVVDQETQLAVFEQMVSRYFPGRAVERDYSAPTPEHLHATTLVELRIETWSAKARRGGPKGPLDADPDAPGTSGVLPLRPHSDLLED
ncbi:MAG TPA: pyridoxamine 5'-phosphate oxidase family protein [Chloroflexota bacterium]|nr:pyridoxamine 5'-phosphate oxidase family protein [Chloroflexota bacterium]